VQEEDATMSVSTTTLRLEFPNDASMLASDRDTLPFPRGGVFGAPDTNTTNSPSTAEAALEQIDRLQQRVDDLSRLVDDTFDHQLREISDVVAHIGGTHPSDDDRPTAA
jgi:hypothetical protein